MTTEPTKLTPLSPAHTALLTLAMVRFGDDSDSDAFPLHEFFESHDYTDETMIPVLDALQQSGSFSEGAGAESWSIVLVNSPD